MKTYYFVALLFLFSAFAKAQDSIQVKVEAPVIALKIPLGKSILAGGEKITFLKVLEDSRCPEGTNCVWEGQVKVEVHFSQDKMNFEPKTATIRGMAKPQIMENANYTFTVLNVTPYPKAQESADERLYELLLKVDKKESY